MSILRQRGELQYAKFDYLLRGPKVMGVDNPMADWVSDSVWGSVQALKGERGAGAAFSSLPSVFSLHPASCTLDLPSRVLCPFRASLPSSSFLCPPPCPP